VGERSHLLSRSIDLDVFVMDIVNVLEWEDLSDVVLVGHSFGGHAISGTADRVRHRIRLLIYLDAWILEDGQTPFSQLSKEVVEACTKAAEESSGGLSLPTPPATSFGIIDAAQVAWVESRMTPQPFLHTPHR
jgi:pimeloyl-ACP methyl ester carboxylesterase